jgi:hypothetical protein
MRCLQAARRRDTHQLFKCGRLDLLPRSNLLHSIAPKFRGRSVAATIRNKAGMGALILGALISRAAAPRRLGVSPAGASTCKGEHMAAHMADPAKPWSAVELKDLEHGLRLGVSIAVIADFIERDVEEVRRKAAALGIFPYRAPLGEEAVN